MSQPPAADHNHLIDSKDVPKPFAHDLPLDENGLNFSMGYDEGSMPASILAAERELAAASTDPELGKRASEILRTGQDSGVEISHGGLVERNAQAEFSVRHKMAEISVKAPATYEALRDGHVVGFHGTRSIALAGVVRSGKLMSGETVSLTPGIHMGSGEHVFHGVKGQKSISFSHMGGLDTVAYHSHDREDVTLSYSGLEAEIRAKITRYSQYDNETGRTAAIYRSAKQRKEAALAILRQNPQGLEATLMKNDFPVLFGVSADLVRAAEDAPDARVNHLDTKSGQSGKDEFMPMTAEIGMADLPVIAVPAARIAGVRSLLTQFGYQNKVVPIEDLYMPHPADQVE